MRTQKELIEEANRVARGEVRQPVQRKAVPPKVAPVVEPAPEPVKRRGRPRKANGTATNAS